MNLSTAGANANIVYDCMSILNRKISLNKRCGYESSEQYLKEAG